MATHYRQYLLKPYFYWNIEIWRLMTIVPRVSELLRKLNFSKKKLPYSFYKCNVNLSSILRVCDSIMSLKEGHIMAGFFTVSSVRFFALFSFICSSQSTINYLHRSKKKDRTESFKETMDERLNGRIVEWRTSDCRI